MLTLGKDFAQLTEWWKIYWDVRFDIRIRRVISLTFYFSFAFLLRFEPCKRRTKRYNERNIRHRIGKNKQLKKVACAGLHKNQRIYSFGHIRNRKFKKAEKLLSTVASVGSKAVRMYCWMYLFFLCILQRSSRR